MPVVYTKKYIDRNPNSPLHHNANWSPKQRQEAVALYKILGNLKLVSNSLGIPYQTLKGWHIQDWWKECELEIANETKAKLTGNLSRIGEKALKVVEDRLENGEFIYDQKTGKIKRKPINSRDANKIFTDSVDRTLLIEKLEREQVKVVTQEKMEDHLKKLKEIMLGFGGKTAKIGEVIDVQETEGIFQEAVQQEAADGTESTASGATTPGSDPAPGVGS